MNIFSEDKVNVNDLYMYCISVSTCTCNYMNKLVSLCIHVHVDVHYDIHTCIWVLIFIGFCKFIYLTLCIYLSIIILSSPQEGNCCTMNCTLKPDTVMCRDASDCALAQNCKYPFNKISIIKLQFVSERDIPAKWSIVIMPFSIGIQLNVVSN